MKLNITLFLAGLAFATTLATVESAAGASKKSRQTTKARAAKGKKKPAPQEHLSTSHNFEDHGVTGEYQMPDEALAKVENEKSLSDLLGVRKHFKDRLLEASEKE